MYIVTNRIKVKKGFAERMAPNFTRPGVLETFEGFLKVEVAVCKDFEEYDEMSVNMYWDTLEHFRVWRESDAFKAAHSRPAKDSGSTQAESPLLGSQIVIAEVVAALQGK
ncbi:heme oxygenase [Ectobacillus sp. sgz5001026]|uniref:heme oxygenase n=1 Tax=Ectobacillus sp. sgz5001026 TaxID=3242473 RepID=UPI0036D332CD